MLFGANGGTGRCLLDQAITADHRVTAVVRRPETLSGYEAHVEIIKGDVLEPGSWSSALVGADAVIFAIGIGRQQAPTLAYSGGVSNVVTAMEVAGVRRLEVISAMLAEPREHWGRYGRLRASVLFPLLNRRFSATYDDMRRMEQILRGCRIDWMAYRPPYLTDRAPRGSARVAVDTPLRHARYLTRGDLASVMLAGLDDPQHFGAIVEVSG